MILFDELKKLRALSADPAYTKRSRDLILAHTPLAHPTRAKAAHLFFEILKRASISLAAGIAMIALIVGGIAISRTWTTNPEFAGLDTATLKAEADQIDIQIQLTELGEYKEEALTHAESTVPRTKTTPPAPKEPAAAALITLDEALELLAE